MTHNITLRAALTGSMLGASIVTAPLAVAEQATSKSRDVYYSPADLATEEGAEKVLRQLQRSAHKVCSRTGERVSLQRQRAIDECAEKAVNRAVEDIGSKSLTASLKASRG